MFALDDRHPVRPVNLNLGFRVRIFNLLIYVPIPSTAMFLMHQKTFYKVESARFRHLETEDTKHG